MLSTRKQNRASEKLFMENFFFKMKKCTFLVFTYNQTKRTEISSLIDSKIIHPRYSFGNTP